MSFVPQGKLDNPQHERAAQIVFVLRQRENHWDLARDAFVKFFDLGPVAVERFQHRIDTLTSEQNT